jgi:hypothetical protein
VVCVVVEGDTSTFMRLKDLPLLYEFDGMRIKLKCNRRYPFKQLVLALNLKRL